MIKILEFSKVRPEEILNRSIQTETEVDEIVSGILSDVRENGDAALRKYAENLTARGSILWRSPRRRSRRVSGPPTRSS